MNIHLAHLASFDHSALFKAISIKLHECLKQVLAISKQKRRLMLKGIYRQYG